VKVKEDGQRAWCRQGVRVKTDEEASRHHPALVCGVAGQTYMLFIIGPPAG